MDTLFISDIHLGSERPEKLHLFEAFLQGPARQASALYILGDLFENFWLGNDDRQSPSPQVIAALKHFTDNGGRLFILRGNRELMLDTGIETLTGAALIPDLSLITLDGKPVLVTHGDVLCTRDSKYQVFRRLMEASPVRWLFRILPYSAREWLVHWLSPGFKQSVQKKKPEIMDVEDAAVSDALQRFQVDEMIHGHTHRPAIHEFSINGRAGRRIVLGDWYDDDALILVCRGEQRHLITVRDYMQEKLNKKGAE